MLSIFLRNVGVSPTSPHGVTTQKKNIDIFTDARTSDLRRMILKFEVFKAVKI
jgi:hypothetical protein